MWKVAWIYCYWASNTDLTSHDKQLLYAFISFCPLTYMFKSSSDFGGSSSYQIISLQNTYGEITYIFQVLLLFSRMCHTALGKSLSLKGFTNSIQWLYNFLSTLTGIHLCPALSVGCSLEEGASMDTNRKQRLRLKVSSAFAIPRNKQTPGEWRKQAIVASRASPRQRRESA